jgi:hypothetical protein
MSIEDFPEFIKNNYDILEWKHAITILKGDFPKEYINLRIIKISFKK